MKLREVGIELLYVKNKEIISEIAQRNHISYELAIKEDYQKNFKSKDFKFRLETRCMCSMVERYWTPIDTKDCWKVIIECNCSEEENPPDILIGGVLSKHVNFDIASFDNLSDYEKKKKTIMLIEEHLIRVFEEQHWDKTSLEETLEKIRNLDYRNEWKWKQKKNKKRMTAEVWIYHDVQSVKIVMYIKDKEMNVLCEKVVVEELPHEFSYVKYLGNLKWETDNRVVLEGKKWTSIKHVVEIP